jgi:hypothetical protein
MQDNLEKNLAELEKAQYLKNDASQNNAQIYHSLVSQPHRGQTESGTTSRTNVRAQQCACRKHITPVAFNLPRFNESRWIPFRVSRLSNRFAMARKLRADELKYGAGR